jgi:NADH-quinone oxidoreductase subunit J
VPLLGNSLVNVDLIAFAALAGVAVTTAILALVVRELIHTILWVSVFFVSLAGIYFLLEAPYLGVLQLGVYAGAVTILLLFGIMVTRKRIFSREAATGIGVLPLALAFLALILVATVAASLPSDSMTIYPIGISVLSAQLFGPDALWVLLLGLVMLAALAGAIYLVREGRE